MRLQLFAERRFAGTVIEIDDVVVAKVTSFQRTLDIQETETTGSEDTVDGGNILRQQFIAVAVGETIALEGIAIEADAGQSALATAAETGDTVVIRQTEASGDGYEMTGHFTRYEESGGVSEGIYTWSGDFRVNSKTAIVGS